MLHSPHVKIKNNLNLIGDDHRPANGRKSPGGIAPVASMLRSAPISDLCDICPLCTWTAAAERSVDPTFVCNLDYYATPRRCRRPPAAAGQRTPKRQTIADAIKLRPYRIKVKSCKKCPKSNWIKAHQCMQYGSGTAPNGRRIGGRDCDPQQYSSFTKVP